MAKTSLQQLNEYLEQCHTRVVFFHDAADDYKSFPHGSKQIILEMITKQAKKGARLRPEGNGIRLEGPLHDFGKIKRTSVNLRIIYRPTETQDGYIQMEIIAIGPRDKYEVYQDAQERLSRFLLQFGK